MNDRWLISIGTSHPWNIAGVGLDARVAAHYDLPHAAAIAAISAQDAGGVRALEPVSSSMLQAQLDALPGPAGAYRVGALPEVQSVRTVARHLRSAAGAVPIVVDPVLRASLGGALHRDADLPDALIAEFSACGAIFTPNLEEAAQLCGLEVRDAAAMERAGRMLIERGALAALITGGHLHGDPVDVLVTRSGVERLGGPRLPGSMRGAGCTLAAALTCRLALGADLRDAAAAAHAFVRERIAAAIVRGGLQVAF